MLADSATSTSAAHAASAQAVAELAAGHPAVRAVVYPGLADHPDAEVVARQTAAAGSDGHPMGQLPASRDGGMAGAMQVTPQQRGYLDALRAAGVRPSSELLALSIGSYVCQAHAAHQSDQAVWDFVVPMVRDDVRDASPGDEAPAAGEVNSVTADYIRIATDRLCH